MARSTKQIAGDETVHYVSVRAKREQPKPKMQPPLTPMIDVTFQLLLFFIVTFSFREAEGQIPGSLPAEGTMGLATPIDMIERPIIVYLRPTGSRREDVIYEIGDHSTAMSNAKELYEQLINRRAQFGTKVIVQIEPRGDVRWQFVVDAFNQATRAKFETIGFSSSL